ncbi:two-component hybrid sensor and regulator [Candidatus Vecturithrix granuli]|uniref:histidine kinase n=1 Tax=Vecturithrix granuli TaxID=1499967 RepID=A0A081C5U5_VECG1|nr:two-component hybrid sensor and regulator [Candidatus Vecturithrix granuli]
MEILFREKERQRTQSALYESETRYRELADSITDIFFALDNHLTITYWNKATEHLTGMPADKALGKPLYDIFPRIKETQVEAVYFKVKETQQPYSFIQPYPLKEKPAFFEISVYPSRDGVSVFAKNVTYHKQMEEALKKSWDYLQNLNNSLGDAIFTVSLPEQTIDYVNKAVEHIFGYTTEECIGKSTRVFFPDRKGYLFFARHLQAAIAQQRKILRTEQLLKRKNGGYFTAEITTTFLNETGDLTGIISIVRDVTDRKQMELALKQERASLAQKVEERTEELKHMNAELARASRLKDEFLANISHDLRTPLNAILGYAKILKKSRELTPLQYEGLNTIQSSGEQLLQLINDILELARIEAGHLELQPVDLHLPEFLQHIVNIIRMRSEPKGIVFVYDPVLNLPSGIRADKKRLHEILINLLDNAVKFTDQGKVTFRVRCSEGHVPFTEPTKVPPVTHLRFEVQDTGPGIPDDHLEEIFLPFQRLNLHHQAIEGTGLGLAISRQFVKMMGGELSVQSTPGEGSLFWFEISVPIISTNFSEVDIHQPEIIGYHGKRQTILLVDDKEVNRAVLRNILLPLGFEVLEAENGRQCLELVVQKHPDVILLDLRMPEADGFETARQIRHTEGVSATIIIAISASTLEKTQKRSLEAGCNLFLAKPLELDRLLEALQTYLHVQWIYQVPEPLPPSQLFQNDQILSIRLPTEERTMLKKFAQCGNITRILKYLDMLEQQGETYLPFVTALRKLAKNFQMKNILELLDQMEEQHES